MPPWHPLSKGTNLHPTLCASSSVIFATNITPYRLDLDRAEFGISFIGPLDSVDCVLRLNRANDTYSRPGALTPFSVGARIMRSPCAAASNICPIARLDTASVTTTNTSLRSLQELHVSFEASSRRGDEVC